MTTVVFNGVTLARPPGADQIFSYHAANWTSVAFCLIGMASVYIIVIILTDLPCVLMKITIFLAFILSILFFRGVGVVGHRAPKTTSAEEQEQEILTPSKDMSPK